VNIIRIINNPSYKPPKKYFDIALMELEQAVTFNEYIQPACLYSGSDSTLIGQKAMISGWGVIDPGNFKAVLTYQQQYELGPNCQLFPIESVLDGEVIKVSTFNQLLKFEQYDVLLTVHLKNMRNFLEIKIVFVM
jgi:hypothetical protein